VVRLDQLPDEVTTVLGATRRQQLSTLIAALVRGIQQTGVVGMDTTHAEALAALRSFNYAHIYNRPASVEQGRSVVAVLSALVEHFAEHPELLPASRVDSAADPVHASVTYVAGMTDRFAFDTAVDRLGWSADRLPRSFDSPHR
jgi:dGTPase